MKTPVIRVPTVTDPSPNFVFEVLVYDDGERVYIATAKPCGDSQYFAEVCLFKLEHIRDHCFEFEMKDWGGTGDVTDKMEKARAVVSGTIKYDGCSDLHFQPNIHTCSKQDLEYLLQSITRLRDFAGQALGKEIP